MNIIFSRSDGRWTISGPVRPSYIQGFDGTSDAVNEIAKGGGDTWASQFDFDRYHDSDDHLAFINEAQVAAAFRNKGIGSRLVLALFDKLEEIGVGAVHLKSMDSAIRFWDRFGFEIVERDGLGAHMFRTL